MFISFWIWLCQARGGDVGSLCLVTVVVFGCRRLQVGQGRQLLRIVWPEKLNKWKKNKYFAFFFLGLCPSNCASVLTLRKSDKQEKRVYQLFPLMREILHTWHCGRMFCIVDDVRDFTYLAWERVVNSLQAWSSCLMCEYWQPWVGCTSENEERGGKKFEV